MNTNHLKDLPVLLAVVDAGSFRGAASALHVTPSAVSQAIKRLEEGVGVPLLIRTRRSVGLTEAGDQLVARCRPALDEVNRALARAAQYGERPTGLLRLNAPRIAMPIVFEPLLAGFKDAFPDIELEIFLDDGLANLAASGFDAGIRLGHMVDPEMIASRLTPKARMAVVASPYYLDARGIPRTPRELLDHTCINFRLSSSRHLYSWRFVVDGQDVHVDVRGHIIVNDPSAKLTAARQGLGLAYEIEPLVRPFVSSGELREVLVPFVPSFPGFFAYYPSRAQVMLKLRAFLDFARDRLCTIPSAE